MTRLWGFVIVCVFGLGTGSFVLGQRTAKAEVADQVDAPYPASIHLTMGNPSNATTNVNTPANYLLVKDQYVMSYNRDRGEANWISWELDDQWLGTTALQNDFRNDTTLPAGWYQVQGTDYSGSGFDRLRTCPAPDRTVSIPDNSASFLMTNMLPAAPDLNQGPWLALSSMLRTWATQGYKIYTVAGGAGTGGTGSNGSANSITGGRVNVPSQIWRVVMVLPPGDAPDLTKVTTSTRVLAFLFPNAQGVRDNNFLNYRVSVDQVEALTGFDFFSKVPASIQNTLESQVDNGTTVMPGSTVVGRVLQSNGLPETRAEVRLIATNGVVSTTSTDPRGKFFFVGMNSGSYTLQARTKFARSAPPRIISVGGNTTEPDITIAP